MPPSFATIYTNFSIQTGSIVIITMAPLIVRATYTEQNALESFLVNIFGSGTVTVIVRDCPFIH
jgi:hypothetical protein